MFILFTIKEMYTLHHLHFYAVSLFESDVKNTETPRYVSKEAPAHVKKWLVKELHRKDVSPKNPVEITRDQYQALETFLLSKDALGKVAFNGSRSPIAIIPGVPYKLGKAAMDALRKAISNYGITIVDNRL